MSKLKLYGWNGLVVGFYGIEVVQFVVIFGDKFLYLDLDLSEVMVCFVVCYEVVWMIEDILVWCSCVLFFDVQVVEVCIDWVGEIVVEELVLLVECLVGMIVFVWQVV